MPRERSYTDWREYVRDMLIAAGVVGLPKTAFTAKLQRYATADEIQLYLEQLREERKADSYKHVQGNHRPTVIWRATTLILEEEE